MFALYFLNNFTVGLAVGKRAGLTGLLVTGWPVGFIVVGLSVGLREVGLGVTGLFVGLSVIGLFVGLGVIGLFVGLAVEVGLFVGGTGAGVSLGARFVRFLISSVRSNWRKFTDTLANAVELPTSSIRLSRTLLPKPIGGVQKRDDEDREITR